MQRIRIFSYLSIKKYMLPFIKKTPPYLSRGK